VSLRARLLITSVVLVAAGLLVANVATYRLLSNFLLNRLDDQLVAAQGPILDSLQFEGDIPGHPTPTSLVPLGTYAEVRNGSGAPLVWKFFGYEIKADQRPVCPRNLPGSTSSPTQAPRFFTTTANGGDPTYRAVAAALSPGPGTLIVAIPLTEVSATLDRLLVVELVVSGIALLLVAGLALWLVRLGLRPLEGIGATAGAIAAGDLSRRVEPATERTEVGRLGLALNAMLAQIEAAFEERRASEDRLRRFVADASHELRTPLTSIRGYAELFRRGADSRPEDLAKSMQRIEREPLDLSRIVEEAVDSARAVEPDRPIDLELVGPTSVAGDEGRLRQAVDNLLDNARVHTPASSRVQVTLGPDDASGVLLTVADEGPGLSSEVVTRAFERFYRGDPSRSRSMGGAGLGLSIVAAIVEAHGGTVAVRSEGGAGATFEVRLPVSGGTVPEDEKEGHVPAS